MNKKQFKALKKQLKKEEKAAFLASLPMEESLFVQLFTYLDRQLQAKSCKHTLRWYLDITTERQRYKGDLQEIKKLTTSIKQV